VTLTSDAGGVPAIKGIPGPYRFFFYSFDCNEPPHVHARRESTSCKFWLEPLALADNDGMSSRELMAVRRLIFEYRIRMLEAWREHCGRSY